jgi:hypothetical protein
MGEMIDRFETKVPGGHMWLMMKFRIRTDDEDGDLKVNVDPLAPTASQAIQVADVGMSNELAEFIETCEGEVYVNREDISLVFHDKRDYMRFRLMDLPERYGKFR